ncbi:MAG: DUF1559 domain-containing protein, partial [Pirellulales bacterium]|nr:DUF1559 domain-containing protein [Pirellulales bacterium]
MQFTLRTLLVFFILVASALGTGGVLALIGVFYLMCLVMSFRVGWGCNRSGWKSTSVLLVVIPVLVALSLPLRSRAGPAARRAMCLSNLRNIGYALRDYHDDYGCFPPACVRDKKGQPLYSWRVLILPYLEYKTLYEKFHLNEPWNSLHNKQIAANTPSLFVCPSHDNANAAPGMTDYLAVTGPGTMWDEKQGCKIKDITDGTDQTLIVIEAARASVPWSKPQDLTLEEVLAAGPSGAKGLMSYHDAKDAYTAHPMGNVLFADGHVETLDGRFKPEDFENVVTIASGEAADNLEVIPANPTPAPIVLSFEARMIGLAILLASF